MHYGQVPHPYTREEGTVAEAPLSARERPGASFTACSRRDSAVWCCPGLAAYGESHNRLLTLPFRVLVYPSLSGELTTQDWDVLMNQNRFNFVFGL